MDRPVIHSRPGRQRPPVGQKFRPTRGRRPPPKTGSHGTGKQLLFLINGSNVMTVIPRIRTTDRDGERAAQHSITLHRTIYQVVLRCSFYTENGEYGRAVLCCALLTDSFVIVSPKNHMSISHSGFFFPSFFSSFLPSRHLS